MYNTNREMLVKYIYNKENLFKYYCALNTEKCDFFRLSEIRQFYLF